MNAYAVSETGVLSGDFAQEANDVGHSATSAGTFSRRRAHYLSESAKPQLTTALQLELIKLAREGDTDAKWKMIAHNMQLVLDSVKRYNNLGLTLLDLVLAGNQGLINALEKFDLDGDISFSTYAEQCVRKNIELAVMTRNHPSCRELPDAAHLAAAPSKKPCNFVIKPQSDLGRQ